MTATSPGDLTWLLEHLVTTVDPVRQVVMGQYLVANPRFPARNAAPG